ncbi:MAG: ABC transporter permease [candidate division KSB1 bacterium]|nr:ABC transporter permease [candidate division KSB1 bacterium]MDZ7313363.1 ABC transporter permease [candidate division KSB1 bacterium]
MIRRLAPIFSLLILAAILSWLSPYFLTLENLFAIGLQMSVVAIMALGQVIIIISGGIDLSVGSVLALSGVVACMTLRAGQPMVLAILATFVIGIVFGWLNGFFITRGKLPPFIATLGTMGIARGTALIITEGVPVFGLPPSFAVLGGGRLFQMIPVPVVITAIAALLMHLMLAHTRLGRHTYAIGGNAEAARLAGVPVVSIVQTLYLICGALCGLAGLILASRLNSGQPTAGTGYELDVIAACVIGGASLSGGEGTVGGALLGALIMGVLRNGCNLLDISAFWQQVAIGAIIIIAVFFDQSRRARLPM